MAARAACYIADVLHELLKALRWEKNESYMNPEPGFQSGPRDSVDAD